LRKLWTDRGCDDYIYWQAQDKKMMLKINQLIKNIERNGYTGIGKPEPLRGELAGWWSRHIDEKNRIVYRLKDGYVEISQCKGHYDDK